MNIDIFSEFWVRELGNVMRVLVWKGWAVYLSVVVLIGIQGKTGKSWHDIEIVEKIWIQNIFVLREPRFEMYYMDPPPGFILILESWMDLTQIEDTCAGLSVIMGCIQMGNADQGTRQFPWTSWALIGYQ